MQQNDKSEVEQFLQSTQNKLGGNLQWQDLPLPMQHRYIDAINFILEVATFRKDQ